MKGNHSHHIQNKEMVTRGKTLIAVFDVKEKVTRCFSLVTLKEEGKKDCEGKTLLALKEEREMRRKTHRARN